MVEGMDGGPEGGRGGTFVGAGRRLVVSGVVVPAPDAAAAPAAEGGGRGHPGGGLPGPRPAESAPELTWASWLAPILRVRQRSLVYGSQAARWSCFRCPTVSPPRHNSERSSPIVSSQAMSTCWSSTPCSNRYERCWRQL